MGGILMATRKYSKSAQSRKTRTYKKKYVAKSRKPKSKKLLLSKSQAAHFHHLMFGGLDEEE